MLDDNDHEHWKQLPLQEMTQADGSTRRRLWHRRARNGEIERRARARRTAHADVAAVPAHDAARDVEPQPDAARIAAPVPVEAVGEVLGYDPGARVVARDPDAVLLLLGAPRDAPAGRRELE